MARLQDDGLVEIVPQLGTFVSRISDAALQDAQFVREALESAGVRLAAERCERGDVASLEGLLAQQADVCRRDDYGGWFVLDDEFHSALCELSGHAPGLSSVESVATSTGCAG